MPILVRTHIYTQQTLFPRKHYITRFTFIKFNKSFKTKDIKQTLHSLT